MPHVETSKKYPVAPHMERSSFQLALQRMCWVNETELKRDKEIIKVNLPSSQA